jgi:hypothetical protein
MGLDYNIEMETANILINIKIFEDNVKKYYKMLADNTTNPNKIMAANKWLADCSEKIKIYKEYKEYD